MNHYISYEPLTVTSHQQTIKRLITLYRPKGLHFEGQFLSGCRPERVSVSKGIKHQLAVSILVDSCLQSHKQGKGLSKLHCGSRLLHPGDETQSEFEKHGLS